MSIVSIRIRAQSQQAAEQAKQQLEQQHGPTIRLIPPRAGRSKNVWFVYGSLQLVSNSPSDLIESFLPTGPTPIWLVEDIPNDEQVAAALDAIRAIRPDLARQLGERFEILDAAFDREGLDRLAVAITRLAQSCYHTRKETL